VYDKENEPLWLLIGLLMRCFQICLQRLSPVTCNVLKPAVTSPFTS
jgi:hypothetical protein